MNIQKTEASGTNYSLLSNMADLARTYEKQIRINEAKELELQIVDLSKQVLTTQYPDILEVVRQISVLQNQKNRLGLALDRQGKYEEAETLHRLAFGGLHQVLGPMHYNTLAGMFSLTYSLIVQDKKEDSYTLLEEFIELWGKRLGSGLGPEYVSYCLSQWEDYYRMRFSRKQQQEQKMISSNEESQHMEDTPAITITAPPLGHRSETPAQRLIRDHPLLRTSGSCQSVQEGYDLQEAD